MLAGKPAKTTITAELSGVDTVVCCGVTTVAAAPIITLCQELVAEGFPPSTPLMVYRDGRLALPIRSIGEAAELEIGGKGIGFTRRKRAAAVVTASPVRQNGEPTRLANQRGSSYMKPRTNPLPRRYLSHGTLIRIVVEKLVGATRAGEILHLHYAGRPHAYLAAPMSTLKSRAPFSIIPKLNLQTDALPLAGRASSQAFVIKQKE